MAATRCHRVWVLEPGTGDIVGVVSVSDVVNLLVNEFEKLKLKTE
jgi:hypothetical protein